MLGHLLPIDNKPRDQTAARDSLFRVDCISWGVLGKTKDRQPFKLQITILQIVISFIISWNNLTILFGGKYDK